MALHSAAVAIGRPTMTVSGCPTLQVLTLYEGEPKVRANASTQMILVETHQNHYDPNVFYSLPNRS